MFYGLVLEVGSCLSPKRFLRLSQLRQRKRRLPLPSPSAPQAPPIHHWGKALSNTIDALVLEGGFCLSPKSFSRIPLVRTQAEKEETPPAPQAPSIRISCSPTSSIHHSQTGRGRRKETSIAYGTTWNQCFVFNFLQSLQKLSKDDTSCGKMSFLWLKT